jgi:hypothetical protein
VNSPNPTQAESGGVGLRVRGLGFHQRIDDPAEQDRLGELRRRKRDVGGRQQPAEACLRAEQAKHATIKSEEAHRGGVRLRGCSLDYQPADWHRVRVKRQIWRIALILLLPEWFDHFRTRRV